MGLASVESMRRAALLLAAAIFPLLIAIPANASEGGVSFYVLGSGGPGAAQLPPLEGIYFDNMAYYYHGEAKADREFVVGGNVTAGLEATILADFATVLWVPSTDVAGATLAFGGTFVTGRPEIEASAILTGPGGGQISVEAKDDAWIIGDPVLRTSLGWTLDSKTHLATIATVNVPMGYYREGQLANLAFHRWIVDVSTALTWNDPAAGWDVSGKVGLTFNGENDFTDYDTGTELHLEGSIERAFSKSFAAGIQAYHFQQISGDSGDGAVLGAFKGRVSGVGATTNYGFAIGKAPVSLRTRVFKEFGEKNRLGGGTSVMLNLSFPLQIKMPAAAPGGGN